jgi:hypothetical protein
MTEEYDALLGNDTWDLVPPPRNTNMVSGKWVFRHKLKPDSSLDRYKARWVLRYFYQEQGVDFDETFSPVFKSATVRIVLSIAISLKWETRQLDMKNAFLHGKLAEVVYSRQPTGFIDSTRLEHVCRLNRSLYGLKQAPRTSYKCFATFITSIGFTCSHSDMSRSVLQCAEGTAFLLLYVDDIVPTASSTRLLDRITAFLCSEFAMTDMGCLHYFLGIAVTHDPSGMHLSHAKYVAEILENTGMTAYKSATTAVDTSPKLSTSAALPWPTQLSTGQGSPVPHLHAP